MRFKLTLAVEKNVFGNKLPINYTYPVSSWIYRVLYQGDAVYSAWLHDNGFTDGNKRFKFFVFSNLYIPKINLEGDRLCILSDTVTLYLSFLPEKSTEGFIRGLFQNQTFSLGDKRSRVQFTVQQIELIPLPKLEKIESYRTLSPVVVATNEDGHLQYISPEQNDYPLLLKNNLTEKYKIYYQKDFTGSPDFEFELLSPAKARLITIKSGTPEEIKVKGYHYSFKLKADPELLHLLFEAGAGEKNALGFGMVGALSQS